MKKIGPIVVLVALLACYCEAFAQSSPNLYNGQVPTAAQWNSYFAAKQDYATDLFLQPHTWTAPQTFSAQSTFNGHVALGGFGAPSPTLSACGTSPSIAFSSDGSGTVTTGTGTPTSCTMTFNLAYSLPPRCIVQDRVAVANLISYVVTTTQIVFTTTASDTQKLVYICVGI